MGPRKGTPGEALRRQRALNTTRSRSNLLSRTRGLSSALTQDLRGTATHPDLSRGWKIWHQSSLGSICHPKGIFSRINWRGSSLPSASEPFSSVPSSLASKLRVSYRGGNCLEEGNGEEMLEQAEVEGFSSQGISWGWG